MCFYKIDIGEWDGLEFPDKIHIYTNIHRANELTFNVPFSNNQMCHSCTYVMVPCSRTCCLKRFCPAAWADSWRRFHWNSAHPRCHYQLRPMQMRWHRTALVWNDPKASHVLSARIHTIAYVYHSAFHVPNYIIAAPPAQWAASCAKEPNKIQKNKRPNQSAKCLHNEVAFIGHRECRRSPFLEIWVLILLSLCEANRILLRFGVRMFVLNQCIRIEEDTVREIAWLLGRTEQANAWYFSISKKVVRFSGSNTFAPHRIYERHKNHKHTQIYTFN